MIDLRKVDIPSCCAMVAEKKLMKKYKYLSIAQVVNTWSCTDKAILLACTIAGQSKLPAAGTVVCS